MNKIDALLDLISRLEAATECDRDLDAAIAAVMLGRITHPLLPAGYTMCDLGSPEKNASLARSAFITTKRGPAPAYTASIDAAVTLIQPGWMWTVWAAVATPTSRWDAKASIFYKPTERFVSHASTPTLALCAAALRAAQMSWECRHAPCIATCRHGGPHEQA